MKVNILNTVTRIERVVEIPGNEILIGSGIECDIVLEGDGIKGQHLRLAEIGRNYFAKTEHDEYKEIVAVYPPTKGLTTGEPNLESLMQLSGPMEIGHYVVSFNGFH